MTGSNWRVFNLYSCINLNRWESKLNTIVLISFIYVVSQSLVYAEVSDGQLLGERLFMNNCATCHGEGGKGNGPMAEQLVNVASDLTLLSKNNGGAFPETVIYQLIDGRRVIVNDEGRKVEFFHDPRDMPVWGDTFRTIEGDEGAVDEIISNLLDYLESIQIK